MSVLSFVFYGLAYHPVLVTIAALALALFLRNHADAECIEARMKRLRDAST